MGTADDRSWKMAGATKRFSSLSLVTDRLAIMLACSHSSYNNTSRASLAPRSRIDNYLIDIVYIFLGIEAACRRTMRCQNYVASSALLILTSIVGQSSLHLKEVPGSLAVAPIATRQMAREFMQRERKWRHARASLPKRTGSKPISSKLARMRPRCGRLQRECPPRLSSSNMKS